MRPHLLALLNALVERMSDAELAKLIAAAGGISVMDDISLLRPQLGDVDESEYFWDRPPFPR